MNLYITADCVGTKTGGGVVTYQESEALKEFGETFILDAKILGVHNNPFDYDNSALEYIRKFETPKLAHFYAGTFSKTIGKLKASGAKVTYTAAAHDVKLSQEEFNLLGIAYDFPHITDQILWNNYLSGYQAADVVICPSIASKKIMEGYNCKNVVVIPHGIEIPKTIAPIPKNFSVGYLGQPGPDKGLLYLIEAWRKLDLRDSRLILAGRIIKHILPYIRGGNIEIMGYVEDVADFYNACSVYCQPSVTEGFGIEVLEAMSYGRPVIVATGAGAADVVSNSDNGFLVPIRNPDSIAMKIMRLYNDKELLLKLSQNAIKSSVAYAWPLIRNMYLNIWRNS